MPKATSQEANVYHFSLRWSTPHTDQSRLKLFKHLKRNGNIDKFIFQAEDTTDNPHYQGYFHCKDKKRAKALAVLWNDDFLGINIQAASSNGKDALQSYAMKEDTRVAGPWADKRIYMGADLWTEAQQPIWQKQVMTKLNLDPGDRKMMWLYDPVGNNGKTKFAKTLCFRHDAVGLAYGHSTDVLNLVSKMPGKRIYVWNLTRAKPANLSELDLYSAMESVKDGFFINLKYETAQVLMDPPHVVVMANHLPQRQHISADRWDLFKVTAAGLVPIVPEVH